MQAKTWIGLTALASLLGCYGVIRSTTRPSQKPNVVVMVIDDAGYADFGFMGCRDLRTPNLDLLAKDGIVFSDGHVTASVCSPSRAGLLTGRYQQRFGYECNEGDQYSGLDAGEVTIAQVLQTNGYKTAGFGKWHIGYQKDQQPIPKGFEYFYGFLAGSRSYFYRPDRDDRPGNARAIQENGVQVAFEGYLTDVLAEKASGFIRNNKDHSFFIYWAPNAVHTPMEASPADLALFTGHPRQRLAAMTHALDRGIGQLISALKEAGVYENTLIFFLSDNGGAHDNESANYPLKGFKGNKYEAGHRVPFVVSWPAEINGGNAFEGLSSSLDIFPTILDATGSTNGLTKSLDGVSLLPYLTGKRTGNPHEYLFWRKDAAAAMRHNKYKLIRVEELGYRLYDLETDPGEVRDIQTRKATLFSKMTGQLEKWEADLIPPRWTEGHVWDTITLMIHDDLMHNRQVRVKNPEGLNEFREKSGYNK